jgi:thiosulfate dehydrogenase [quinone] large subunit
LILIGLGLILGFLARPACIFGILLLSLYYLSHPPFPGLRYAVPNEGSYLIINKTLIELLALVVLYVFPNSKIIGIDRFIFNK